MDFLLLFCNRKIFRLCFILFCGEFEEFFVGLNRVSDKLSVAEQRVSRNRRGNVPGGFFVGYMNRSERNSVFFRNFAHPRNPVACERALICVIQNESALVCFRVLRAGFELRRLCVFAKGQIHKSYSALRNVGGFKTFVSKEFRVGRDSLFFPSEQRIQIPFLFCVSASRIHSARRSLE